MTTPYLLAIDAAQADTSASAVDLPIPWNMANSRAEDWTNAALEADDPLAIAPALPDYTTPWWMDGKTLTQAMAEPAYLVKGLNAFWGKVRGWLLLPLQQRDPLTCNEQLLTLLAWDRDITRFNGEPLELFRLRVKYAWQNARDAGGAAGFLQIFERLGLTINELRERQLGVDWDVITIVLDDENTASNAALFQTLIQHYGRTCRRYYFQVQYPTDIHHRAGHFGLSQQVFTASLE